MQKIVNITEKKSIKKKVTLATLKNIFKSIPTKYLYDEKGSKLFEDICNTKEYYLTRVEEKLLKKYSLEIVKLSQPEDIFEFGSGSSKKSVLLISARIKNFTQLSYSSLDISDKALNMSFDEIKKVNKSIKINLFKGDFLNDLNKIYLIKKPRLFLFLGSTLGNFDDKLAIDFLGNLRKVMNKKDYLLLGLDMIKDVNVITAAYNDSKGITRKFNKNILSVINKKYQLNFKQNNFEHKAEFNSDKSQVEMFLKSKVKHSIEFADNSNVQIEEGERILTEISRKFSFTIIEKLLAKSGLKIERKFQDNEKFYSLLLIRTT